VQAILRRGDDPGLPVAVEGNRLAGSGVATAGREPLDADAPEGDAGAGRPGRQQPPPCEPGAPCPATVAPTSESGSASASIERLRARVSAFYRGV